MGGALEKVALVKQLLLSLIAINLKGFYTNGTVHECLGKLVRSIS